MKTSLQHDTTLQITRVIGAPRPSVFAAWTDLSLAGKWWGPDGCKTHELIVDPHPGGQFRWVLSSPDGERMTAEGEFREVRPGAMLAYTWRWVDDPAWDSVESLITVEFKELDGDRTELRLTHENLPSQQSRDNHVQGWNCALDKLERLLAA
jgi:uncharacterized protein YndB with AHSA1/START domain